MLSLVRNEWEKLFRQKSTYLMIGLLILVLIASGGIGKYMEKDRAGNSKDWKQELKSQNAELLQEPEGAQITTPSMKEFIQKEVAVNEYRIERNLPPEKNSTVWSFINDASNLISFAGLFVMVAAAGIVANEFTWGTIKMLAVKPFRRWKILLSKYITVLLYLLLMMSILFVGAGLIGLILFGAGSPTENIHLAYVNGQIEEQNLLGYLLKSYGLQSISVLLLSTMAFMISVVFRASGLAIGLSVFLLFTGGTVTNLLASKFEWAKFSLFANTDLMQYLDGLPMVDGMTIKFSILMLVLYFSVFQILAFFFFTKRDIAA